MSDNFLCFIPTDPSYFPSRDAAESARTRLAEFVPDADEVTVRTTDEIEFVDQGANFERLSCPRCKSEIDRDWWGNAVDRAYEGGAVDLTVTVPCCGATISLNDLDYHWPAGFARFVLEAMNPNVEDLRAEEEAELQTILGTPLRRIWAHY